MKGVFNNIEYTFLFIRIVVKFIYKTVMEVRRL